VGGGAAGGVESVEEAGTGGSGLEGGGVFVSALTWRQAEADRVIQRLDIVHLGITCLGIRSESRRGRLLGDARHQAGAQGCVYPG